MFNEQPHDSAFSSIYSRFKKPIFQYVANRITDIQVAEELTQEVFLKVYRFHESYDKQYAFSTWLWSIARNTVYDALRKTKIRESELGECVEAPERLDEIPCRRSNAEALLHKKDLRRNLVKLMKPLTQLQKRVLWMRVVHQYSYAEISKQLGLSLAAAKNLAYRAKLTLSQSLDQTPALALV